MRTPAGPRVSQTGCPDVSRVRPATWLARAVLLGLAMLLSTSCSTSEGDDGLEQSSGELEAYRAVLRDQWDDAAVRRTQIRAEEYVAECMAALGFDYVPLLPDHVEGEPDTPFDDREFAEAHGFGISTSPRPEPQQDPGSAREDRGTDGMSETERIAYAEALYGPPEQSSFPEIGDEPMGCHHEGYRRAMPMYASGEETAMFEDLRVAMERIPQSPVISELDQDWAECMAGRGFEELESPRAAAQFIEEELARLSRMEETAPGRLTLVVDEDGLPALQALERRLALATLDCEDAVSYREREERVIREVEDEFVSRYRNELDAWLAWHEEQLS